ncbi:MAG TPA: hypothetical protein DD473_21590 [Planctomycetaceae bacterium]|nr:hypothetical protein [Planctomycetaceae bacterium]
MNADDFLPRSPRGKSHKNQEQTNPKSRPQVDAMSPVALRLAVSQMTTKKWSFRDELDMTRELGLKHVGLWRWKYEEESEQRTADLLEDYCLNVSSISWIGGFTGTNGYLLEDILEESKKVIRFASWIGARTIVVSTGERGTHIHKHVMRVVRESLLELADFAAEFDIHLAISPMSPSTAHGWTFITSLRKCRELLEQCNHEHIGLCLHGFHSLQERHWKAELRPLLSKLKLVRLSDGLTASKPRKQCLPFSGKMNLVAMLEFLESNGYSNLYEIDTWSDDVWQCEQIEPFQKCLQDIITNFPPASDQ